MINTETSKRKAVLTLISLDNIYSLGVRTLSSFLKARDFQVNAIFLKTSSYGNHQTPNNRDILLDLLAKIGTDIVGLSVKTPYLKLATDITNRIQESLKIKVIWGGTHPTILPEECIQVADIICRGEGEYALLELLERLHKGDAPYGIQNLWVRDGNNIHRNSQRPLLQDDDLNALPFPDYNSEDMYFVNNGFVTKGDPVINNSFEEYDTIASRGCPFRCSYCVNSILRDIYPKGSKFIRKRDPENVVNEIEHALNVMPNIQKIRFQDEVFPWEENWLAEFRDVYKRRINLPFVCTYHPNMVSENRIGLLRDAGMATLGLGIQSACEKIRQQVFARPESNEQILKSINILHKNKIEVNFDLILDNPYETQPHKEDGLRFLLNIPKPFTLFFFSLRFFPMFTLTTKALSDKVISEREIENGAGRLEFRYEWNAKSKKEDMFWGSLFVLASRSCIPRGFVKYFGHSAFIRKNPKIIFFIVKISKYPEFIIIGLRRLMRGHLKLSALLRLVSPKGIKKLFSKFY